MEHLACEIGRVARQIQADLEALRTQPTQVTESAGPPESTAKTLGRIERRLGDVHEHTSMLVERVPRNLDEVLSELKRTMIMRLDEAVRTNEATGPKAGGAPHHANESDDSAMSAVRLLTPQERQVFQLCFQSGFLSYRDIAAHLDIKPGAAKNLVNRIFQSDRKRPLFTKQYRHGTAKVGVSTDAERRILGSDGHHAARKTRKARQVIV